MARLHQLVAAVDLKDGEGRHKHRRAAAGGRTAIIGDGRGRCFDIVATGKCRAKDSICWRNC